MRTERLRECVDVMRALFAGEEVSHDGHVVVDRARLWTLPERPPPLLCAAVSEATARWGGEWADGLATVNAPAEHLRRMIDAFGSAGQLVLQVHLAWAPTDEEALRIAYDQWRTNVFDPPICWDLDTPEAFDVAAQFVQPEDVRAKVLVSSDLAQHAEWLQRTRRARLRRHRAAPRRPGPGRVHRRLRRARPAARRMRIKSTSDLWWKDAVLYCLDVEKFHDDLAGLTERVDYLAGLGVSCLWLMPFYPSPNRDDGYDIVDFYSVDKRLGTLGDFTELVRTAHDRGIRVIADFVMNHTSDQHPWFQSARHRDSPYRDFYVWRDEKPEEKAGDIVFPDQEDSNWAWDEEAGQFYLHKFYSHQPDLNLSNPAVRDELAQVMGFWLQQGLSGFRVDAVPFLIEGSIDDPHKVLRDLRAYVNRRNGEAVLLGEVNLKPKDVRAFLGDEDGDELHMVIDFIGNQALYLALDARRGRTTGPRAAQLPADPGGGVARALREKPRRADPGQADQGGARGGLRALRAGRGHAALRARDPAPAAVDARRRRARDPDGLLARVLAPGHARCCSTARRSAWKRTCRSKAG